MADWYNDDDDDDDGKLDVEGASRREQSETAVAELTLTLADFFHDLRRNGFTREEAHQLVIEMYRGIVNHNREEK